MEGNTKNYYKELKIRHKKKPRQDGLTKRSTAVEDIRRPDVWVARTVCFSIIVICSFKIDYRVEGSQS